MFKSENQILIAVLALLTADHAPERPVIQERKFLLGDMTECVEFVGFGLVECKATPARAVTAARSLSF